MGAIIRSRAAWYEYGGKSNKHFLNLENRTNSKNCIRKNYTEDGCLTSDPKRIMKEVERFYFKVYQEDNSKPSENELNFFFQSQGICKLSNEDALEADC